MKDIRFHVPENSLGSSLELQALQAVQMSAQYVGGSYTKRLESYFAVNYGGHAVSTNSCTNALKLVLKCLNIKLKSSKKRVVLVPCICFASDAHAVIESGFSLGLLDCTDQLQPSLADLQKCIQKFGASKLAAVVLIDYGGHVSSEKEEMIWLCEQHGIKVILDCAHSLDSLNLAGERIGHASDDRVFASVFSFHPTKPSGSGRGGMIVTKYHEEAKWMKIASRQGIVYLDGEDWAYDVMTAGYNYSIDEWNAALIWTKLQDAESHRSAREKIAQAYDLQLPEQVKLARSSAGRSAWHLYVISLPESVNRKQFQNVMLSDGVQTSAHWRPLNTMSYFNENCVLGAIDCTNALAVAPGIVSLPIYSSMTDADVNRVVEAVKKSLEISEISC